MCLDYFFQLGPVGWILGAEEEGGQEIGTAPGGVLVAGSVLTQLLHSPLQGLGISRLCRVNLEKGDAEGHQGIELDGQVAVSHACIVQPVILADLLIVALFVLLRFFVFDSSFQYRQQVVFYAVYEV